MKVETLKDLAKLIKLCRETGIEAIEVDGIKMNLGQAPVIIQKNATKTPETFVPGGITENTRIEIQELTEEQLINWSVQDHLAAEQQ